MRCPNCDKENPEGFRFCGFCTAPLEEAAASVAEERKVVTVLFCDLVGFTARSDAADPEDVRARIRPYHTRLRAEIERYGGTVEKFVGDAVMAVFGAPVAHEDDPERAVRAGLRILEAIEELNEARPDLELSVRVGINTGEAVVALDARPEQGEGIVTGDVVNTASRLQSAAPVDSLIVGEVTQRATSAMIEYEPLEPVTVKGKPDRIPIWRALQARGRFGVNAEGAPQTPFIGRQHDLRLLQETYARTVREKTIQLATITGEPGVGKTRLVAEFLAFVDGQPEVVFWRRGRCLPYGEGITFWALREIMKAQAGILESDSPEQASTKLDGAIEALVQEAGERGWFKVRLAPLVGVSSDSSATAERLESFTAWRRFLEALATTGPLVLVFEDLHWADRALLEFVEHLVDWATGVPMLVVCTARPELYERHPGWGGGKRNSTTIALSPLTSEDTARLLSALLSRAVLPAETQTALLERAGGNPLYAEEFIRMLTDRGFLTGEGRIAAHGEIPVPETVQALIAARLDTLPSGRKSLLHDAAVVGKVFWAGAVSSIGGMDAEAVGEGLHELARKELLRPARSSSVKDEAEYSFWHVLIRDVAYGQIPRAARVRKHQAAAEWIEAIAGDRLADHAEILAHHYGQALMLARASATADVTELEASLRRFLVFAGDRAIQLDVDKADSYYRQALELLPADHPEQPKLLAKAAEAAWLAGRIPEAERSYEEAIAGFRRHKNILGAGEAMVELVAALRDRGETARSHTLLVEAIELLEREPPGRELALAYMHTARDHMLSGQNEQCLESSAKAIALCRQFSLEDHAARALQFHGIALSQLGDLGGLEELREALELSLGLGLGYYTVNAYGNLADQVWVYETPAQALDLYRAGIDFGERRGVTFKARWIESESLWPLYDLGRWDELLEIADRLIEWDETYGRTQVGVIALTYKAQTLVQRGKAAEAAALRAEFLPRAQNIGDPQVLAPALATAALIEQTQADLGSALALIESYDRFTREHPRNRAVHLQDVLRVCTAAGAIGLAEGLLAELDVQPRRSQYSELTGRAVLAEAGGELERAAELYADAAERWAEYGFVLEHGHAMLGQGRCLHALGDRGAAGALRDARELFARLGARPLLDETDALLKRTAGAAS